MDAPSRPINMPQEIPIVKKLALPRRAVSGTALLLTIITIFLVAFSGSLIHAAGKFFLILPLFFLMVLPGWIISGKLERTNDFRLDELSLFEKGAFGLFAVGYVGVFVGTIVSSVLSRKKCSGKSGRECGIVKASMAFYIMLLITSAFVMALEAFLFLKHRNTTVSASDVGGYPEQNVEAHGSSFPDPQGTGYYGHNAGSSEQLPPPDMYGPDVTSQQGTQQNGGAQYPPYGPTQ